MRTLFKGILLSIPVLCLSACNFGIAPPVNSQVKKASEFVEKKEYDKALALLQTVLKQNPRDAQANYFAAQAEVGKKNLDTALEKLDAAVDVDPKYAEAYSLRGLVLTRMGEQSKALGDINHAIHLAPETALNYLRRAMIHLNSKQYKSALTDLDTASKLAPKENQHWCHVYRGQAYLELKDFPKAKSQLDEAIKLNPANAVPYLNRATCLARSGHLTEAMADCVKFLKMSPKDPWGHALKGALHSANGHDALAMEEYKQVVGRYVEPAAIADIVDIGAGHCASVMNFADMVMQRKDPQLAAAILTRVEAHRPLEPQEQYRLAVAQFALKQPERAIALLNACIAMSPEYIQPRVELIRYYASTGLSHKALELQREAFAVAHTPAEKAQIGRAVYQR